MDWDNLIASLDRCILAAEEDERRSEEYPNPGLAHHPDVLSELERKLIEIHCRIRAIEEEASDQQKYKPTNFISGTITYNAEDDTTEETPAAAFAPIEEPSILSPEATTDLVLQCRRVLLLNIHRQQEQHHALVAQLLAEMGRSPTGRVICVERGVVAALERALEAQNRMESGPMETTVQICRILGNICFNCNKGREQVMTSRCLQHLVSIANNRRRVETEDPGQRFPVILPGFLLNFCNETADAVQMAGEVGFVHVVVQNILSTQTNDAVFNSNLNFLIAIAEDESGPGHRFLKQVVEFADALTHVLSHTTSPEVAETALELVRSIADDPELTLTMVKTQLCSILIRHIEGRWQCKEFEDLRADACDLLVLMLSHDASMKHIYVQDDGRFLQTFMNWLKNDDAYLKVTACLAIGNFACSEDHCTQLIDNKTAAALIELLQTHQNPHTDLKLQHALLGAVRNLAVSPATRRQLLEQGLLDPCLRLTERLSLLTAQPVIFKLLATLRLVVDGSPETAQEIGHNRTMIASMVEWGSAEMPAIRAESSRLLAALIKHSNSPQVMETVVSVGGLALVTAMLTSPHVRMLNEALVALTVLAATLGEDVVHQQLHTDLVINSIKNCLTKGNDESSSLPMEVRQNAATLALTLLNSKENEFRLMLRDLEFQEALDQAKDVPGVHRLNERLRVERN